MLFLPILKFIILFVVVFASKVFAECGDTCKNTMDFLNKNSDLKYTCAQPGEGFLRWKVSEGKVNVVFSDGEIYSFDYEIEPETGWLIKPGEEEDGGFDVVSGKIGEIKGSGENDLQCDRLLFNLDEIKEVLQSDKELQWVCSPPSEDPVKLSISEGKINITHKSGDQYNFKYRIDPNWGWLINPEYPEAGFDVLLGKMWSDEGVVECKANATWVKNCVDLCNSDWWYSKPEISISDIKTRLEEGEPINGSGLDAFRHPPLWWATYLDHTKIVEFLINKGADLNFRDLQMGQAALHLAVQNESTETIKALVDNGADIMVKNDSGETPFAQLNPEKYPVGSEIYKILNPVTKIKEVLTNSEELQWVCNDKRKGDARVVVSQGKINFTLKNGETGGWSYEIHPLTGELIDPEYPEDGGLNIFSGKFIDSQCEANAEWVLACMNLCDQSWWKGEDFEGVSLDDVKAEVAAGYPVKGKNEELVTPLHYAVMYGSAEIVEFLIKEGADMKARLGEDMEALTPLLLINFDNPLALEILNVLIENGADINQVDNYKRSLLHEYFWSSEQIETLVKLGADLNSSDLDGSTPLHDAAEFGESDGVKTLVSLGANILTENNDGEIPFWKLDKEKFPEGSEIYNLLSPAVKVKEVLTNNEGLQWLCSPPDETPFKLVVSDGKITFISSDSSDGSEPFTFPFTIDPDFGWLVNPEAEELSGFDVLSGKIWNEEEFLQCESDYVKIAEVASASPSNEISESFDTINQIGTGIEGKCKIFENSESSGAGILDLIVTKQKIIISPEEIDEIAYYDYFLDKNTGYLTNPENKSDQLSVSSGLILSDGEAIGQCDFEPIEKSKNGSKTSSDKTELLNVAWDTYKKGDYKQAFNLFKIVAESGIVEAQAQLGRMYFVEGESVVQNYLEALKWLMVSAEQDNSSGQYYLGVMYDNGIGINENNEEAAKWYQLSAEQGDRLAQNNLGAMYHFGEGVPQNFQKAVEWYRMSAEQGDVTGQFNLGWMYDNGKGVDQNKEEAAKWYQLSAEQNYSDAQNNLGKLYEIGEGIPQNYSEALKWFRLSAEQGNESGQFNLGFMYDNGLGGFENNIEAVKWYQLSADQGYSDAQFSLGIMYHHGEGVPQNYQEAIKWYRLSAEQQNPQGQYHLGLMYDNGLGINENNEEAVKWYRLASEQGNSNAQNNLGLMYEYGEGVTQNYPEAFKLYKNSAYQDNTYAKYNLGKMYYEGKGVSEDFEESAKWYKRAADDGHNYSKNELAKMYHDGKGVVQNYTEAMKLYKAAADQGIAESQYRLGLMYDKGQGVSEDDFEAVKWFKLSADQGFAKAQNSLGNSYYNGSGVEKSLSKAFDFYRLSAEQGYDQAQRNLGFMYDKGKGVAKDQEEAFKWYLLAANQGHAKAQNTVGNKYYWGKGTEKNHKKAVEYYMLSAEQGNDKAQRNLGYMFAKGKGVPKDDKKALKWYLLSAEQGNAKAQNSVGNKYYQGKGTEKDYKEAVRWYKLAAYQGHTWGQHNLAGMYNDGKGVNVNFQEAVRLYKLAADKGNSRSQNALGIRYYRGEGVEKNYQEAVKWYRLSAENNYSWGQYNLGFMYDNGNGVVEDNKEAVKWYELAAKRGNSTAQFRLANQYREGSGVKKDDVYAYMWLKISSNKGYKKATEILNELNDALTFQEIQLANMLSDTCKESKYKKCSLEDF